MAAENSFWSTLFFNRCLMSAEALAVSAASAFVSIRFSRWSILKVKVEGMASPKPGVPRSMKAILALEATLSYLPSVGKVD